MKTFTIEVTEKELDAAYDKIPNNREALERYIGRMLFDKLIEAITENKHNQIKQDLFEQIDSYVDGTGEFPDFKNPLVIDSRFGLGSRY